MLTVSALIAMLFLCMVPVIVVSAFLSTMFGITQEKINTSVLLLCIIFSSSWFCLHWLQKRGYYHQDVEDWKEWTWPRVRSHQVGVTVATLTFIISILWWASH